jgi:hypothetical protein
VRFTPVRSGTVTATLTAAGKRGAAIAADVLTGAGRGLGLDRDRIYWALLTDQGGPQWLAVGP